MAGQGAAALTQEGSRAAGYEAHADAFIAIRDRSTIGVAAVREWALQLPPDGAVLDLGCGSGVPVSEALLDLGLAVHGVDASPRMVAAFRARFPAATVECSSVDDARIPPRAFDGVIAWGLIFLLAPDAQRRLVHRAAEALKPGGRLLFTAPWQACRWVDVLTGLQSVSLGAEAYRRMIATEGLVLLGEADDEGENHYYFATQPA